MKKSANELAEMFLDLFRESKKSVNDVTIPNRMVLHKIVYNLSDEENNLFCRVLDKLISDGYVVMYKCTDDELLTTFTLTDKGLNLI